MGISRAAQSPTLVHRSFKVTRLHRRDALQVRTLWWWGKRSRGWMSSENDDAEEKLRRHQALMMHRYSKAMRRRSLWDRDNSPRFPSWRVRGCTWEREMSSTKPQNAKVEEQHANDRKKTHTWQEFHKDFESFKRAVDKAIERDPYGTLFGRRLRSPDTPNNSSWTSWSWIFDPKEIKREPQPAPEKAPKQPVEPETKEAAADPGKPTATSGNAQKPGPSVSHASSSSKTATTLESSHSILFQYPASVNTEYVYDPISGRKVPQPTSTATPPPSPLNQESPSMTTPSQQSEPTRTMAQMSSKASQAQPQRSLESETRPSQQNKTNPDKSFVQAIFGENGVDIPVKVYKPPKVFGYTGEPKPAATESKSKEKFESTRKRELNQLRLRTLGNNIDATNFNCEPWNNKDSEFTKVEEPVVMVEKRVRSSPSPSEDAPLFSGTTYQSKMDELSPSNSDWLANEGFRARRGLTMPSLKEAVIPPTPREPATKMETALDRTSSSAAEKPIKKFTSKLQPAMDRILQPARSEPVLSDAVPMQAQTGNTVKKSLPTTKEENEDIDLLRASDVRAATKVVRVTKQGVENKKQLDRDVLEKDFDARQQIEQHPIGVGAKHFGWTSSAGSMDKISKHIKQYPEGIVARTMQNLGIATGPSRELSQGSTPENPSTLSNSTSKSDATVSAFDAEARKFRKLAADLNAVYKENVRETPKAVLEPAQKTQVAELPKFSEPTLKPGVSRNLAIERHTKEFEPKFADIVDRAKSVKRELHDVRLGLGDVINERAISSLANRDLTLKKAHPVAVAAETVNATQQQPAASESEISVPAPAGQLFKSPYILLIYNRNTRDVEVTPLNNLMSQDKAREARMSPMAAIGSLNSPNAFIKHFVDLDKNDYELTSGGGDMLIFRKRESHPVQTEAPPAVSNLTSTSELRSTIAAAEAAAQPKSATQKAANVLDELPPTIPAPGPAAPTAPSSPPLRAPKTPTEPSPSSSAVASVPQSSSPSPEPNSPSATPEPQPTTSPSSMRSRSRINRQEEVFSGRFRLPPQTTALPDPEHFQKQNPGVTTAAQDSTATAYSYASSQHEQPYTSSSSSNASQPGLGFFARVRRGIRRIVLTAIAVGAGAYGIGVVAEGLNAKAQIANSDMGGPMRRIVMEDAARKERQRAGIFSTESSR